MAAAALAAHGFEIRQNPAPDEVARARHESGDVGRPTSNPDYLIEGRVFDCYSPDDGKPIRGIWSEAADKVEDGQTQRVAERAMPEPSEGPTGTAPLLSADLRERLGFELTLRAGRSRYVSARGDDDWWEWEPSPYVSLTFHMDRSEHVQWQVLNMLPIVDRVLGAGIEDAALVLNGDVLLLTRLNGGLTKQHRVDWWENYPGANDVIRG